MATNAPNTKCWICGKPNEYRVVERHRRLGSEPVFGPTEWQMVPHPHTQAEVAAWSKSLQPDPALFAELKGTTAMADDVVRRPPTLLSEFTNTEIAAEYRRRQAQIDKVDTHDILRRLVDEVNYKPGWTMHLEEKDGGLFLIITDTKCRDAYDPEHLMHLSHEHPVPMAVTYNEATWKRWIFEQCRRVENHEIGEWLRWGNERPCAPCHGPGEDPYTVHEFRNELDSRVTQNGSVRNPDPPADGGAKLRRNL